MYLQASINASDTQTVVVEKRRHNGTIVVSAFFPVKATSAQRIKACKVLGVPDEIVLKIDTAKRSQRIEIIKSHSPIGETYSVRSMLGRNESRRYFDTFEKALLAAGIAKNTEILETIPLIEWGSIQNLCCLDLDFDDAVPVHRLRNAVREMTFCPRWLLTSKSGSVHLIYEADELVTADEWASCGLFELLRSFPQAKYELIARTRTSYTEPEKFTQYKQLETIRKLLMDSDTNADDFTAWLVARGMVLGKRYDHSFCPVAPSAKAKGNPPVQIHKHGIKCHYCESNGKKFGSKDSGWFPARALVGGVMKPNEILACAGGFVHYDHAQPELEKFNLPEVAQRPFYSSLLKATHGVDDPRIPLVWSPTGKKKVFRADGFWVDENFDAITGEGEKTIVDQLPFLAVLKKDFSLDVNAVDSAWARQTGDLSVYGYRPYRPLMGYQFSRFDDTQSRLLRIMPYYMRDNYNIQPQYINESKRLSWDDCRAEIVGMFPGLCWNLLVMGLIGRGHAEYISDELAMLAVTGPTGSGKTLHFTIAAAISGDMPQRYSECNSAQSFYEGIAKNSAQSQYFIADEFLKNFDEKNSFHIPYLLSLTPQTGYHKLYHGHVKLNCSPFVVITDTTLPLEFRRNEQIARRFVLAKLDSSWAISEHLRNGGFRDIGRLRMYCNERQLLSLNSLLSHITDIHFTDGRPDFAQASANLGFGLLRNDSAITERNQLIKELVAQINQAKRVDGTDAKRFGADARVAKMQSTDSLWNAFAVLQNEADRRKGELECNALDEADLGAIMGSKIPLKISIKKHGRNIYFKVVKL